MRTLPTRKGFGRTRTPATRGKMAQRARIQTMMVRLRAEIGDIIHLSYPVHNFSPRLILA